MERKGDLRPVYDPKTGEVQLFDVFDARGRWLGSRRTLEQAFHELPDDEKRSLNVKMGSSAAPGMRFE